MIGSNSICAIPTQNEIQGDDMSYQFFSLVAVLVVAASSLFCGDCSSSGKFSCEGCPEHVEQPVEITKSEEFLEEEDIVLLEDESELEAEEFETLQ